ncbi:hypothetical protein [Phaeacidiphilus oryzae]|uniref:hypothetical protein n=1 Tax=Phaeacidiphilus oryzae TaxID=348818 RepID=UPI000691ABA3|nr:hypothetical protein [Phaeacidiphilus oryzae]
MKRPGPSFRQRLLIESLTVLAADAPVQTGWLGDHGVTTDDLAQHFGRAYRLADALVAGGYLHAEVLPRLRDIDRTLDELTAGDDADRWTTAALAGDEAWDRIRQSARQALITAVGDWDLPMPTITVVR